MIRFWCDNCGRQFIVPEIYAGRRAACKSCGAVVVVPGAVPALPKVEIDSQSDSSTVPRASTDDASSSKASTVPAMSPPVQQEAKSTVVSSTSTNTSPAAPNPVVLQVPTNKTPVRIRRLAADARQMEEVFRNSPLIRVVSSSDDPPDRYTVEYRIHSLARGNNGQPVPRDQHVVEIQLTRDYPRQSPKCRMLTPIFHPNVEPAAICVGDHWTAAERLTDLVIRIGEMIAYQTYNIKSPLDGEAAMWADLNRDSLPTDKRDLRPPDLT
jgi:ubiquitin-protein ligase/DNA-directed RNA polymerase subunit RPC12/RpoP